MSRTKKEQLLLIAIVLVSAIIMGLSINAFRSGVSTPSQLDDRLSYLELINDYRASKGLLPVQLNDKLDTSAQLKADDMAKYDYWQHDSPNGVKPWHWFNQAGYGYTKAGEVLARCYDTPEDTVQGWINSEAHEATITGDYNDTGFGSYIKPDGCRVVIEHFGKK